MVEILRHLHRAGFPGDGPATLTVLEKLFDGQLAKSVIRALAARR
jgi:hypothetical protein